MLYEFRNKMVFYLGERKGQDRPQAIQPPSMPMVPTMHLSLAKSVSLSVCLPVTTPNRTKEEERRQAPHPQLCHMWRVRCSQQLRRSRDHRCVKGISATRLCIRSAHEVHSAHMLTLRPQQSDAPFASSTLGSQARPQ
jgi:hypothetical protein